MSQIPCRFGHEQNAPELHHELADCHPHWSRFLTPDWRDRVVEPRYFRVFREYEMPARRVLGFDTTERPCYCTYDYRLFEVRSDDDEEYYEALTYSETLTAWRLHSGRWLVYRQVEPLGEEDGSESGFVLADRMPR